MNSTTIHGILFTDEEIDLPVEIDYSYRSMMLTDDKIYDVVASVKGVTVTDSIELIEQVKDMIREHQGRHADFESEIELKFPKS